MLTLTFLVDDEPGNGDTRAEHGLSMWIDTGGFRVLLDAGQWTAARNNARILGIGLAEADAIAISHGHYDHTGGLPCFLSDCPSARLFLHPDAMKPRYSRSIDGRVRSIGYPHGPEELRAGPFGSIIWMRELTHISPSIFVTGEIPRSAPPEAPAGRFFVDSECHTPDPFLDDQALVVDTDSGAVVILGCSHSGVWNTLSYALSKSRSKKLRALIGGMHLAEAPQGEIERLADRVAELSPSLVCPCHCSGRPAKEIFRHRFPVAYREGYTGATLTLNAGSP